MSVLHTWTVFKRFRAGIFGLVSLLNLAVAIACIIMLVNGWAIYQDSQKAAIAFFLSVNMISCITIVITYMSTFQPVSDLIRAVIMFVFQLGLVIVFTLAAPNLPCPRSNLVQSCKTLDSLIFLGACLVCAFLAVFILVMIPMLKRPFPSAVVLPSSPATPRSVYLDVKRPLDPEKGSTLTYCSWDRIPGESKDKRRLSYSQTSFQESYFLSLQSKNPFADPSEATSPKRPPPPPISKSPYFSPQILTPQSALIELSNRDSQDMTTLSSYAPMPLDPKSTSTVNVRGSVSSVYSLSSRRLSEVGPAEPQQAITASPKSPFQRSRRTRSDDSAASLLAHVWKQPPTPRKLPPTPVSASPKASPSTARRKLPPTPITASPRSGVSTLKQPLSPPIQPLRIKRKVPQQLSLDDHLRTLEDSSFSAVPRTPSPISGPYSPASFGPVPNSGLLPSHPRLTMHMRELKLSRPVTRNLTVS